MVNNFKVITLCGSTKFKEEFIREQKRLTLEGNIVLTPTFFSHTDNDIVVTDKLKDLFDSMHRAKIDMSDEILVINVGGYIGSSTKSEIDYAIKTGKKVNYIE